VHFLYFPVTCNIFPDILKYRFVFIFKHQASYEVSFYTAWPWGLSKTSGSIDPPSQRHCFTYRKSRILVSTALRTSNPAENECSVSLRKNYYTVWTKCVAFWVLQKVETMYSVTLCYKRLIEYMGEFTFFMALNYV